MYTYREVLPPIREVLPPPWATSSSLRGISSSLWSTSSSTRGAWLLLVGSTVVLELQVTNSTTFCPLHILTLYIQRRVWPHWSLHATVLLEFHSNVLAPENDSKNMRYGWELLRVDNSFVNVIWQRLMPEGKVKQRLALMGSVSWFQLSCMYYYI